MLHVVDMSGVAGSVGHSDLNVTGLRPSLATRHCVLLVNIPNTLNLLSWILIYLCALHETFLHYIHNGNC